LNGRSTRSERFYVESARHSARDVFRNFIVTNAAEVVGVGKIVKEFADTATSTVADTADRAIKLLGEVTDADGIANKAKDAREDTVSCAAAGERAVEGSGDGACAS
jgi:hypothetical protein